VVLLLTNHRESKSLSTVIKYVTDGTFPRSLGNALRGEINHELYEPIDRATHCSVSFVEVSTFFAGFTFYFLQRALPLSSEGKKLALPRNFYLER